MLSKEWVGGALESVAAFTGIHKGRVLRTKMVENQTFIDSVWPRFDGPARGWYQVVLKTALRGFTQALGVE